jgi:cadmium resistance protein CadD (predicted permease)
MNIIVLILAIAMVVPFPLEEIVGGYVRLLLIPVGLTVIIWWLIKNDQKKDQSPQGRHSVAE